MSSPVHSVRLSQLHADLEVSRRRLATDRSRVDASRAIVERALAAGGAHYGINTGFGALARQRIPDDQLEQLQRNLLVSHAVGVGEPVPRPITKLMLELKLHALALGYSGISASTLDRLLMFAERDWIPIVPSRGSVGASGDLAPLAHMCLPLIGLGEFWDADGVGRRPAEEVLREQKLEPIVLHAKDGLALVNGTQLMTAYGAHVLEDCLRLVKTADIVAAISLEALQGSIVPFDARIHEARPHPGQRAVAENVRALLQESAILESHRHCGKVQDPYSLRCVPQVHGASRDALAWAGLVIEREINSATDNPLVFEDGAILSGGNFHGQPLALALDLAAIAIAELGSISERRSYLLLGGHDGLPPLLMKQTGLNSGLMITQYTAAALVSENKALCHPASVDSIPTSLGQEDHVSMGSVAAVELLRVFENVVNVLGVELLCATQALDYREPRPGRGVESAHRFVRGRIEHTEADHPLDRELARSSQIVREGALISSVEHAVGELH